MAIDEFGWNACRRRYGQFFATVEGHRDAVEKPAV
jgi:hypothetical protein